MAEDPAEYLRRELSHLRLPHDASDTPGSAPGRLRTKADAPPPIIHMLAYGEEDSVDLTLERVKDVQKYLDQFPVLWLDVRGLYDASVLTEIGELFDFGALALEDIQEVEHRAKVDFFEKHVQVRLKMPYWTKRLEIEQISVFMGANFVVTFQSDTECDDYFKAIRERVLDNRVLIRSQGADFLGYAIIDRVIDAGFPVIERFANRYEEMEIEVVQPTSPDFLTHIHAMNCQLWEIKRWLTPHQEILEELQRRPESVFSKELQPYLNDCLDHAIQIHEATDNYHALGQQLIDFHLSLASQRQNEITRILTIIATIFIPLTFITSVYGMNFDVSASPWTMPELDWPYAYPAILAGMLIIAVMLVIYFWRKGWIGKNKWNVKEA